MQLLRPAIQTDKGHVIGEIDDSHVTLGERLGISYPESKRGFSDGKNFYSRRRAIQWIKAHEFDIYKKIIGILPPEGLHSEIYAKAHGIKQKEHEDEANESVSEETEEETIDLSDKTAIVYDRGGLYLYCAEKLAEKYKKVMYFLADADAYPTSQKAAIGEGLSVERIHDFFSNLDKKDGSKVDCVYFFDCYDGELQQWLRDKGYTVFGSGRGERVEIDKILFLETLEKVGLNVPKTYLAEGLDDLKQYLEKHDGETLWLKNMHRGDFETRKFTSMKQIKPFIDDLKKRIGTACDDVEVLVQHKIDSACEVGYDGFCIDGQFTENCIIGYEVKDKGFIGKVFETPPYIVKHINDAFTDTFRELGYRGNYSTEIRITDKSECFYIDATCRVPSPPGELICEIYENWAESTYEIACGCVPILVPKAEYGAVIILTSEWHDKHELYVEFPKSIKQFVKLKNHSKKDGAYYCTPNGNGGFFGAVIAYGNSVKEATGKCLEYAEQVRADEMEFDDSIFDKANEQITTGKQFEINF